LSIERIDLGDWRLGRTPALLRATAMAQPDAILMQYPTEAFSRGLAPPAFAISQRIAPLVVTLHEFSTARILRKAADLGVCARARHVVLTTDTEHRAVCRAYPPLGRRSSVIPIGSNIPGREWQPREAFGVVYFGQIRPEKGIEEFLDLAEAAAGVAATFQIVGSPLPRFQDYFESVRTRAASLGVTLLLGASEQDVSAALATASLCYLPFPDGATMRRGSLMAALECGVPVLTTVSDQTPPALRACITPAADTLEASGILRRAVNDRDFHRSLQRNHARSGLDNRWDSIASQYVDLFHDLLRLQASERQSKG
jgi:glycosyltransferase involved in cell wall biosynthesis